MKIRELILFTEDLDQLADFYGRILGFRIEELTATSLDLLVGSSRLKFRYKNEVTPYHFAMNIPENSVVAASEWLRERTELISFEKGEIINFPDWQARSVYFRDPANNIVELISRRGIGQRLRADFTIDTVLSISEIGIGTEMIEQNYLKLMEMGEISMYSGDINRFCALGNPEGLIILANPKLKTWFPTEDRIHPSELIVKGDFNFKFSDGIIQEIP